MSDQTDKQGDEALERDIDRTEIAAAYNAESGQPARPQKVYVFHRIEYGSLSRQPEHETKSVGDRVRISAIPVALIGAGLAWFTSEYRSSNQRSSHQLQRGVHARHATGNGYENTHGTSHGNASNESLLHQVTAKTDETGRDLKDKASEVGERASQSASEATERAKQIGQHAATQIQETAEQAQARMNEMGQRTQMQYYRTKDRFGKALDEQPFIIAALGIAVGAAIGATLPRTRRENELLGETRDELVERATDTAREQAEVVKESAQRVAQAATQEAQTVTNVAKEEAQHVKNQAAQPSTKRTPDKQ